jgi:peptidoglycan/LPS O-acetylase OafA/YrhL
MKQSLSINYLRFFTAFAVLLTHFGNPTGILQNIINLYDKFTQILLWSNRGLHYGVIIFVVLSGFLIHKTSRNTNTKEYLIKRIIRIYPLFIITSFAGLCITNFENIFSYFLNIGLFTSFIPNSGPPGNPILITVVVEIVIYFLYVLLRKIKTLKVLIFLFLIYIINFIVYLKLGVDSTYIERNLFSLIFYWYIGAYGYEFFILENRHIEKKKIFISFLIYVLISNLFNIKGIHYFYSIIFAFYSAILISYLYKKDLNKNVYKLNYVDFIINKLGEAAYSIYAWHFVILLISKKLQIEWNSLNYLLVIFITILIAMLSYNLIEKYFNKKRFDIIKYFKNS